MTAPTLRGQVIDTLGALGDTEKAVAAALEAGGYRGYPGNAGRCPIAAYLQAQLPPVTEVSACPNSIDVMDDVDWGPSVPTPVPVSLFMSRFDDGHYPGLIAPTLNAKLAYRVLDHIDAHPEQWSQREWIYRPDAADCGTAGCFAGWACMLSGDQPMWNQGKQTERFAMEIAVDGVCKPIRDRAVELLGIDEDEDDLLFDACNTRGDLGRLVAEIFGPRPDGEVAR